ncbi:MAG: C4-dicarboxylate transporter DcuC [Deltaproteobacteria bacterium]|nr:C4-dicarboxylate transporter DcuC [Deltaproteobacteria bacterium]
MDYVGPIAACLFIVVAGRSLLKGRYPHAVLLLSGLAMMALALALGYRLPPLSEPTGASFFDFFRYIEDSFAGTLAGVGLMIMAIGGFVAYMDDIGASQALVRIATRPLKWFSKYPYATTSMLIPIGQLLFVTIPSAAGLGLLLMASVYPLIIRLGVSRLSAVSVIVACTSFGIGPASAITVRAAAILDVPVVDFFSSGQIPLVIPASLVMAVAFFFVNRIADRKLPEERREELAQDDADAQEKAPAYYAIFPVLPLLMLLLLSGVFSVLPVPLELDTTTAMIATTAIAAAVHALRVRDVGRSLSSLKIFWKGMADIFATVVTLIIAADIFAKGLISLDLIGGLLRIASGLGLGAVGVGILMSVMIFLATILMGSGNASFFAFGPLAPKIASGLGANPEGLILPMQLSSSMGRSVSPIAGVVIATAEIAKVPPMAVARRNFIPLGVALVTVLVVQYAFR